MSGRQLEGLRQLCLVIMVLAMALAVMEWLGGHPDAKSNPAQSTPALSLEVESAVQSKRLDYIETQFARMEARFDRGEEERRRLVWLLLVNLAAVLGSVATHLILRGRRLSGADPQAREGTRGDPL